MQPDIIFIINPLLLPIFGPDYHKVSWLSSWHQFVDLCRHTSNMFKSSLKKHITLEIARTSKQLRSVNLDSSLSGRKNNWSLGSVQHKHTRVYQEQKQMFYRFKGWWGGSNMCKAPFGCGVRTRLQFSDTTPPSPMQSAWRFKCICACFSRHHYRRSGADSTSLISVHGIWWLR